MTVQDLFRAGELKQAIQALGNEVRDHPADTRRRTFLFELLCFAGEFDRATKHLSILSDSNQDTAIGGLLFRSALRAERQRQAFFEQKQYTTDGAAPVSSELSGSLNGERFTSIEDADPRVGPRLEAFIAGEYVWLPFEHIGTLKLEPPKFLRDLLWPAGYVTAGARLKGRDLGEALFPALYPFSWRHESNPVKLGRETDWIGDVPFGQKLLLLDGEKVVPFLEIRTLEFDQPVDSVDGSPRPS